MKCTCGQYTLGENVKAMLSALGVWHYREKDCRGA